MYVLYSKVQVTNNQKSVAIRRQSPGSFVISVWPVRLTCLNKQKVRQIRWMRMLVEEMRYTRGLSELAG